MPLDLGWPDPVTSDALTLRGRALPGCPSRWPIFQAFRRHPVGFLLVRAVEALARWPGEAVCYSDRVAPPDDLVVTPVLNADGR